MRTMKAWLVMLAALVISLTPLLASADDGDPGPIETLSETYGWVDDTVRENWVEPVPSEAPTWFCLLPPVDWVCFPPFMHPEE